MNKDETNAAKMGKKIDSMSRPFRRKKQIDDALKMKEFESRIAKMESKWDKKEKVDEAGTIIGLIFLIFVMFLIAFGK